MTNEEHDENVHDSVVARRNRRRKQAVAGAAGLALLGAGAFLVTSQLTDSPATPVRDAAAPAPLMPETVVPDTSDASSAAPSVAASASASATASPSAAPSASPTKRTDQQRIQAARSAAAKASGQVKRPLTPMNGGAKVAASDLNVKVTGSVSKDEEELRLYSAREDLTGQRELAWVTDDFETSGNVNCTQKIRLSANVAPKERPTLLICWRTSAAKSVYTVAVKVDGRPAKAESIAAINKEWTRLG